MGYSAQKEPLYRKVNTCTHYVRHGQNSGDYRHDRNTKSELKSEEIHRPMNAKRKHGLDYTPLFKFLLSKVGTDWTQIHSEAVSRLDKEDPIFWLVAKFEKDQQEIVRVDENSYYSGLYIDENNILQKVAPQIEEKDFHLGCGCCTQSFNGKPRKLKANS